MDNLKSLVEAQLAATGRNPFEAAKRGGLERSFINDILINKKRNVTGANIGKLAAALGLEPSDVLRAMGQSAGSAPVGTNSQRYVALPNAIMEGPTVRPPDTPILPRVLELGIGVASVDEDESAFQFNGQTIDHVPRPPGLANRQDVFALRVANLSMWPKYRDGERIYVDTKRPAIEDFVVIELLPSVEDQPGKAYVKMLVSRDGKKIRVQQFNPEGFLEFRIDEIKKIFRVIPNEELW